MIGPVVDGHLLVVATFEGGDDPVSITIIKKDFLVDDWDLSKNDLDLVSFDYCRKIVKRDVRQLELVFFMVRVVEDKVGAFNNSVGNDGDFILVVEELVIKISLFVVIMVIVCNLWRLKIITKFIIRTSFTGT